MKNKHSILLFTILVILALSFILNNDVTEAQKDLVKSDSPIESQKEIKHQNKMDSFILPTAVKPSTLVCKNYLYVYEAHETWQAENKAKLKKLLISLVDKGLTGEELDHVAFLTRIGSSNAKALIGLYNLTNTALPIISGVKGVILAEEYTARVYGYLLDHKTDVIISLVEQGVISGNSYIISDKGQHSLIGTLLMSDISLIQKTDAINQLIHLKVDITYQDLMIASQLNIPIDLVEKLWFASELNASFVLPLGSVDKSLAQIALESKNIELLDFWFTQGSASVIEPFQTTLLDIFSSMMNEKEKPVQLELFLILMKHGLSANSKNTQYKLKAWLDDEYYSQFQDVIEKPETMSLDIANKTHVGNAIREIFFTVLQPLIQIQDSLNVQHPCFQPEALRVINNIFKTTQNTQYKPIDFPELNKSASEVITQNLYSQEELLAMDVYNANAILGKDKSLAAKYSISKLHSKRIKMYLESAKAKAYTVEELEDEQEALNLIELAESRQWQKVIMELTENKYPTDIINFVMVHAVLQKKNIELILQLHKFSSTFSTAFMHAIVKRNDVNLARVLVSHGLNFTRSNNGVNAIYTAVLHRKMAMLRYLIDEGITVKPLEFGLDPLDIALQNLTFYPASFNFITVLIDAGAPIEPSHREMTFEFSLTNLALYVKLTSRFPKLKSV
ncbi:MAG: ankyrin repeat domain-containing protein [Colwellia sp.]|nr:ankyrin repeat domain-containing protein [Colwellia sp.]